MTVANWTMVTIFVKFNCKKFDDVAILEKEAPRMMKIVNKIRADKKAGPLIEAARETSFLPF